MFRYFSARQLSRLAGVFALALAPLAAQAQLLINELDADTPGTDALEFVELYDGGAGSTALSGHALVFYNGSNDLSYFCLELSGSTDSNGYYLVGNAGVTPSPSQSFNGNLLQNGQDAVGLYQASCSAFPNNTAVTTANLVDAVVYDTSDADDAGLLVLLNAGQPQVDENGNGSGDTQSIQRNPNGSGGTRNTSSFVAAAPTPGASNGGGGGGSEEACGDPRTLISAVQGSGLSSPMAGSPASIEGIVTGDFQGASGLGGFYLQDTTGDGDDATSEGIFVFESSGTDVAAGDLVRVVGTVTEFSNLTEMGSVTQVTVCSTGNALPAAQNLFLPLASATAPERFEGMRVALPQTLTVSENYDLALFGELVLSSGGRLLQPTQVADPGAPALAVQASNNLNRIVLDNASSTQNPDPVPYPSPGLSAMNTLRTGDTVSGVTGVLTEQFGAYRIQPTALPSFTAANARPMAPALPGSGSLRVASFNVLNYFNGDGLGGGFPTARGANTQAEFERQRAKTIAAIVAMNADIIGLMELENDGFGPNSAIQDLVNGLNAAASPGTSYAFVNPGVGIVGTDEIKLAFLYRVETVQLVGGTAILDSSVHPAFIDTRNRPTLAQSFREIATGGVLTVVVNHLKSKGSGCEDIGDPDLGDGQGNCNATRAAAAGAILDWLSGDPTGSNDADFLIIGDLNAYAKEDPVATLTGGGYTNLIAAEFGDEASSYVFQAQSGYLDHALASPTLLPQVSGISEWHINADEPRALDYNVEFKSVGQVSSFYAADPYRSSDHDPVVVELALQVPDATPNAFGFPNARDVAPSTLIVSAAVTPTGYNQNLPVSMIGAGEYSIGSGDFTSASGTIAPGQSLRLRQMSSAATSTATQAKVNVGGTVAIFTARTRATAGDISPDAFNFNNSSNLPTNALVQSKPATPVGYDSPAPISVSGGEYSIDGGAFTAVAGTVSPGSVLRVRTTSPATNDTKFEVGLQIGNTRAKWLGKTAP